MEGNIHGYDDNENEDFPELLRLVLGTADGPSGTE